MYVVFVYNAPATPEKTHRNKLVLLRWQLTRLCVSGETNECSRIYGDGSGGSTPPVTHCQMEKRPNCKFFQQTFDFICGVPTKINTDILHRSRKALCNLGIWLFPRDFCSCVSYSWVLVCVLGEVSGREDTHITFHSISDSWYCRLLVHREVAADLYGSRWICYAYKLESIFIWVVKFANILTAGNDGERCRAKRGGKDVKWP